MGNSESSIKKNLESRPVVVIIGGGYGGTAAAKILDKHFNVVVIERKKYFFHNIGALRGTVDPDFRPNVFVPYDKLLKYGYVVQAEVEEVSKSGVKVKGREAPIGFDYLLIALGTSYAFPAKVAVPDLKSVAPVYQEVTKAIDTANNILIIGGGPVGIELTGEIHHKHPNKSITLLHAHESLSLGKTSPALGTDLEKKLRSLPNVNVILGDRAKIDDITEHQNLRFAAGKRQVTTEKGKQIETDLVFFCGGSKLNNSSLKAGELAGKLDDNGRLKVNKYLQVEGFENLFAVGDIANVAEGKLAYLAGVQAAHAAANIINHDAKKDMKEYKVNPPGMFVTIGPKMGAGQLPTGSGTLVGNTLLSFIKGGNLFANKFWGDMNQKPPKSGENPFDDSGKGKSMSGSPDLKEESAKSRKLRELNRMSSFMKITDQEAKQLVEGLVAEHAGDVDHT